MAIKIIGFSNPVKGTSKKTGQPYDFVNIYAISNENSKYTNGWEPVTYSFNTDELQARIGVSYNDMQDVIDCEVEVKLGMRFNKPMISGLTIKPKAK